MASTLALGCNDAARAKYPTADSQLKLSRVVLYRNGIGYFERVGEVDGDVLTIKVRKDQVNDLLKSLTVVERESGKAVSVSMPLDPQSWANAALATLAPGRGNLAEVLDSLRGTVVTLSTTDGTISGRIVMVEELNDSPTEPPPVARMGTVPMPQPNLQDHRVTLIDGNEMKVVRLSKVRGVTLEDGDLAMQLNRTLDASAGEGMFQQIAVSIRLAGASSHDLLVSYVVSAPMWKPTYRVVLPKEGKGKALLQGWAVVDNTSGEDWADVNLGLTSGAPIAFRYDLHTPREVERSDLTESGVRKQAQAMVGESTFEEEPPAPPPAPPATGEAMAAYDRDGSDDAEEERGPMKPGEPRRAAPPKSKDKKAANKPAGGKGDVAGAGYGRGGLAGAAPAGPTSSMQQYYSPEKKAEERKELDFDSLRRSTLAQARAASVAGQTRYDLDAKVTVPDGTSTMVAIINADVEGEETFLFRPGGAGLGYESNPYRVVRFRNTTPFVLEPGPIAIYAGGSFVGEGLSETVGSGTSVTIPFAVETGVLVSSTSKYDGDEMRLVKMSRGILEVEQFGRRSTTYTVKAQTLDKGFNLFVRHPKSGFNYELAPRPEGTEDLADAYLIKVVVAPGKREGSTTVTEQTPSRTSISIWDKPALEVLEKLMLATDLGPEARKKLQPVIERRREVAKFDEKLEGLVKQRQQLDQRAAETRQNLEAIQKDNAAAPLRQKLTKRLEEFANEGNRIGREIVELENKKMEKRIELEDLLQDLDLTAPPPKKGAAAAPAAPASSGGAAPAPPAPKP
jgi:hypothetical protein